jgi:vancomycin resistance protein VanJ
VSRSRLLTALCWIALVLNLGAWFVIRHDNWSVGTLLSFGPRWIWLLPPVSLLPAAYFRRRRLLPLMSAILVAAIPILQFEFGRLSTPPGAAALKVVSMNAGSKGNPDALLRLVAREQPDIVVLQEWAEPKQPFTVPGYALLCQEALCVLSPFPMERSAAMDRRAIGGWNLMVALTEVETPQGRVSVASVHLATPRKGIEAVQHGERDAAEELSSNIVSRGRESRIVSNWLAEVPGPMLIAGDFNLPSDSAIYREHWTRWSDAFEVAGWGYGWTKFTRWWGIRIDHILFDPADWQVIEARVGDDVGSDHRPVIAKMRRK